MVENSDDKKTGEQQGLVEFDIKPDKTCLITNHSFVPNSLYKNQAPKTLDSGA